MPTDVTQLLNQMELGDPKAADELLPLVYEELRRLAAARMAGEKPGQTLQATALVHEAYLRLIGGNQSEWNSRGHFYSAAAEAMRRILVERARRKQRLKHGRDFVRIEVRDLNLATSTSDDAILAVHEALDKLAAEDPQGAELIKLRFFAGLPNVQAAKVLGIPERTAKRVWSYARAWLFEELKRQQA